MIDNLIEEIHSPKSKENPKLLNIKREQDRKMELSDIVEASHDSYEESKSMFHKKSEK